MRSIKIKIQDEEHFMSIQKILFKKGFQYFKTAQELKEYDPDIIGIHAFWNTELNEKFTRLLTITKCPKIWGYYRQSGFLVNEDKALAAVRKLKRKTYRA